ncbi:nicotinamidase [Monosporozyma unispora]
MKALLVIDAQNDFVPPDGSLAVGHGDEVIQPIIKLMNDETHQYNWDKIILTRDWHTPNHTSFAKSHGLPDFSPFVYDSPIPGDDSKQDATLWPVHCVQNTKGSQLVDDLIKEVNKHHYTVVNKGYLTDREYYSAFNDIWNYHKTELNELLQEKGIDEVYVVGLALDFCVKNTAISAAKLGYKTTILKGYTRAINTDAESMQKLNDELAANKVTLA